MVRYAFLGLCLTGFLNECVRADYNVPLGLFCFLIWDITSPFSHRARITYLLAIAMLADLLWILCSIGTSDSVSTMVRSVQVSASVGILYKMILTMYLVCRHEQCQAALTLGGISNNFQYFLLAKQPQATESV